MSVGIPGRDPRRNFTKEQQAEMLLRQKFRCADCGRHFDRLQPGRGKGRWKGYPPAYHHVEHHEHGGRTEIDNGVALCRHCHHWGRHGRDNSSWCQECLDAWLGSTEAFPSLLRAN